MKTPQNQLDNVRRYRERHKEKLKEENKKNYRNNTRLYIYHMLKRAEKRAAKCGIPFELTADDIVIPAVCPVFGCPFEIGNGSGPGTFSPSIDRIVPKLGYVKTNIKIISGRANLLKNDATVDELEQVIRYMLS